MGTFYMFASYSINQHLTTGPGSPTEAQDCIYFTCSYIQKLKSQILFCRHFRRKVVYVTAGPGSAAPPQIGLISCKLNTCKLCHHPNLLVTKLA